MRISNSLLRKTFIIIAVILASSRRCPLQCYQSFQIINYGITRNVVNDDLPVMRLNIILIHMYLLIIRITRNIKTTNQFQDRLLIRENVIHNSRHHGDDKASEIRSNGEKNDEIETGDRCRTQRTKGRCENG